MIMFSIRCNSRIKLWKKKKGKNPERTSKSKPFTNKYNWEGINYPSKKMIGKNLRGII